jgi:hypothetical protein
LIICVLSPVERQIYGRHRPHPPGGEDERFVTLHPNAILMPTGGAATGP